MAMLPVRRWSDAWSVGRVKCWKVRTMPKAQNRGSKRFKCITKTIHFAPLGILLIYFPHQCQQRRHSELSLCFRIYKSMAKPAFIFDGRKMLNHEELGRMGFHVETIGRRLHRRYPYPTTIWKLKVLWIWIQIESVPIEQLCGSEYGSRSTQVKIGFKKSRKV